MRISPFDPQKKRHTSFAQVVVYPDLSSSLSSLSQQHDNSDPIGIDEIKDSDLKVDEEYVVYTLCTTIHNILFPLILTIYTTNTFS